MKTLAVSLLSLAAALLFGACDSHSFNETKVLHEKYQHGHGEHHAEGGEHKAAAGHEAPAAGHEAKAPH